MHIMAQEENAMRILAYNREEAVAYASRWAYGRNPAYYNFDGIGGDCTNFASQCLFAGAMQMNFTPDIGWYYKNANNRAAAWSGVEYFYNFLIRNAQTPIGNGQGPIAQETDISGLEIGDFVQFGNESGFYHTPVVVGFSGEVPLLAAHTNDTFNRPLTSWRFQRLRCIHITGVRQ